ncbi:MAG: hypothetical protein ACRC7C_18430, partial [Beijerinckiaceae bacterium]
MYRDLEPLSPKRRDVQLLYPIDRYAHLIEVNSIAIASFEAWSLADYAPILWRETELVPELVVVGGQGLFFPDPRLDRRPSLAAAYPIAGAPMAGNETELTLMYD